MATKRGRVTIREIAREAGVSVATVSRVLSATESDGPIGVSSATAERIRRIARRLGYVKSHLASRLKRGGALKLMAVVFPGTIKDVGGHVFFLELMWELERRAWERGYAIVPLHRSKDDTVDSFREKIVNTGVSSVVAVGSLPGAFYDVLRKMLIPYVAYEQYPPCEEVPSVYLDYREALEALTDVVFEKYETFYFLTLPMGPVEHTPFRERYEVFMNLSRERGLEDRITLLELNLPPGTPDRVVLEEAVKLLEKVSPSRGSFVLGAYDILSVAAHRYFKSAGFSLGYEVGVAGFDDLYWVGYLDPPITTVRLPRDVIAEAILGLLSAVPPAGSVHEKHVKAEVVFRGTV